MSKLSGGCLGLALILALGLYGLTQTQLGRWMGALGVVYGGAMVAGAVAHDVVPGVVTEVRRANPPTEFYAGSISFRYADAEGREQTVFRRVKSNLPKFRALEAGAAIDVWVCKADPSTVKLVGYGTHEPNPC